MPLYDNIIRSLSSLEVLKKEVLQQFLLWLLNSELDKVTHSHENFMCAMLSDCTVTIFLISPQNTHVVGTNLKWLASVE